jgi:hypothetical protein
VNLFDVREDIGLCAVTLLQSWLLLLRGGGAVSETQPIMLCRDGRLLGSREVVGSMRDTGQTLRMS